MPRLRRILKWSGLIAGILLLAAAAVTSRTDFSYTSHRGQIALGRARFQLIAWDPQDPGLLYTRFGWAIRRRPRFEVAWSCGGWRTAAPWGWGMLIPLWAPLAATLVPAIALWAYDYKHSHGPGRCAACGYDLRGLAAAARCPECGLATL